MVNLSRASALTTLRSHFHSLGVLIAVFPLSTIAAFAICTLSAALWAPHVHFETAGSFLYASTGTSSYAAFEVENGSFGGKRLEAAFILRARGEGGEFVALSLSRTID
jgi:hypothetical protein